MRKVTMRKPSKFLMAAVVALGFAACNNNEDVPNPSNKTGDTFASVTLKFAQGTTTRTLPEDYNKKTDGWKGRDNIETISVFLVNSAKGTIDFDTFHKGAFGEITPEGVLKPNLAVKATSGDNVDVYVVVNGKAEIINMLKATSATNFATVFANKAEEAVAADVAKFNKGTKKETVMMTNTATKSITVQPNVTEEQAKNPDNPKNHAQVQVERVVARTMLTVETNSHDNWKINKNLAGVSTPIAEVTNVQYAVGQSNKKFFIMKKAEYVTPDPVYAYVPSSDWNDKKQMFDYAGLQDFTNAQPFTYKDSSTDIGEKLNSEETSKFVLPVTHKDNYKKGNTTYVEIRAKFKPLEDGWGDTEVTLDNQAPDNDLFLGMSNGKFYSSETNAKNKDKGGVEGQKVKKYTGAIMKYVVWLNPNDKANPTMSPTVRNQIYHIHVSSFKEIGLPNNPINPEDPKDPDNPINPDDPLVTPKTYLSVSVKVLDWNLHSYTLDLGNNY
ncbi:Mfa1 family fimbria major subunit [Bacteroides pyogenes]|uniref:Mfa1 family fimbria major subunit n=1 Tax=Bacteroides pyogenes TaxID=310300 RepID=UPI0011E3FD84|nr:Mfa1 family fimbria major subunit [Bacteroides pyogenes]TYK39225.1 hypothetical protein FNJ59_07835 [Bacteroides pyogenes]